MPQTPSTELLQNPEHSRKLKCVIFEICSNLKLPSTPNYNNNVNTGFVNVARLSLAKQKSQPKLPKSCWFNNIDFFNDVMPVEEYKFFIMNKFQIEFMSDYSCKLQTDHFAIFVLRCFALFSDV